MFNTLKLNAENMAHAIVVRLYVDDEYADIHPEITATDYLEGSKAYGWEVMTERMFTESEVRAMLDELEEDIHDERYLQQFRNVVKSHGVSSDPA